MNMKPEQKLQRLQSAIALVQAYDMDGILEYVDMIDQYQCLNEYFHRK